MQNALDAAASPPIVGSLDRWSAPGWSLYDLHRAGRHQSFATVPYHRMHITQLRYLAARLGDPGLAERCRDWEAQLRSPARRLAALSRKIRYRLASPAPRPASGPARP